MPCVAHYTANAMPSRGPIWTRRFSSRGHASMRLHAVPRCHLSAISRLSARPGYTSSEALSISGPFRRIQIAYQRGADPLGRFQTAHELHRIGLARLEQHALERQRFELSEYDVD